MKTSVVYVVRESVEQIFMPGRKSGLISAFMELSESEVNGEYGKVAG
ncbi:hypothetical protein HMPREF0880_00804 [Yokenella regensburgei ATCC 43003]|jgi:hypothetical protein|nr:hypothetical protein HMPREF0880_00804 [Yokenella regensburgei ATCC 43003]